ncbi:serine/threonine protein kinase [Roseobacter sp. GAI101]|uniref:serine/threonine protein kinase n=1 Tax=Roseobacter sp. (strain GAI101) TaxID=391589 RepID=UPI0001871EFA|nr:serine/threonine-protein kinase [Roseobacter sp. GAI101]EEB82719.1 serine/threonine protein kinase [Roseobacter sp. GAI101]
MSDEKKTSDKTPDTGADDDDKTILFSPQPAAPAPAPDVPEDDDDRTIVVRDTPSAPAPVAEDDAGASVEEMPQSEVQTVPVEPAAPEPASAAPVTETPSVVAPNAGIVSSPITSLEPGMVINNMYRVEESLDQGGMGRVFRGEEIGTGESVAIKVILPEMAEDTKVADMFRREARVLRQLHHDAIVRYFAYVPPDENLSFHALVMGFIQGTKLSDTLKEGGPLKRSDVIKLTMRLADGLERAHSIGVVHRDLSPDNVMLQDGDIGKAVLIDFGISRSSTVKDVTIGNEFAGKLKYVSPEQLGSFGGQAEGPSDVYSLGLLMIAMLMGKPYNMGGNFAEAVQLRMSVPDISMVPEEFQPMLHAMLQPDPKLRMSGMTEVKDELRAMMDGEGMTTRSRLTMPVTETAQDRSVPGLQAVPFASTSTGGQTSSPRTMAPTRLPDLPAKSSRGLVATLMVAGLAAVGGAAVFFAGDFMAGGSTDGGSTASDPVAAGLERTVGSRATFLAETVPQDCAYAARRTHGDVAGLIEGFAQNLTPLQGIGDAYGAAFGSTPDVVPRNVTAPQCAVLDFARSLQGTNGGGVELSLTQSTLSRSEGVQGTLHGSAGRQNWLALVDPNGQVFSLMRQFDDAIGDERRFAFRLPSAAPGIYMLVATASDSPLVRAGAMRDGTQASDILPLMTRELATDGQGAADVAFLELTR